MSEVEVFLDDTPGETRGVIARNGRFEHLLIQRDDDIPQHRLGAWAVGRVSEVAAGLRGAFVDLGADGSAGFLPLAKGETVRQGDRIKVEVVAEPRERKGATLRRRGAGEGEPRLLRAGPDVRALLAALAPDAEIQTGVAAIQASWDAEEEAIADTYRFPAVGIDLAVQRTRALTAVDIDHAPAPGRDARKGRAEANRGGLIQAARLVRLKGWGGLVVIDLVGTGLDAGTISRDAQAAFAGDSGVVFGPLSRFGLLQLALPWRRTPIEEQLARRATRAIGLARRLRHALLSDTTVARFTARCAPEYAQEAAALAAQLGPRAGVRADPTVGPGHSLIEEG